MCLTHEFDATTMSTILFVYNAPGAALKEGSGSVCQLHHEWLEDSVNLLPFLQFHAIILTIIEPKVEVWMRFSVWKNVNNI